LVKVSLSAQSVQFRPIRLFLTNAQCFQVSSTVVEQKIARVHRFFAPSVWYKNIVSTISSNVAVFLTNAYLFLVSSPINCLLSRSL
jgi:hypothetical protein